MTLEATVMEALRKRPFKDCRWTGSGADPAARRSRLLAAMQPGPAAKTEPKEEPIGAVKEAPGKPNTSSGRGAVKQVGEPSRGAA